MPDVPSLGSPVVTAGMMSGRDQPRLPGRGMVLRPFNLIDTPSLVTAYTQPSIPEWHIESLTPSEAVD
jgi:hypothetical protein